MTDLVALVWGDAYQQALYDFGSTHPLQPIRVQLAVELMRACGLLTAPGVLVLDPRLATVQELRGVHHPAYVDAVQTLSAAGYDAHELTDLARQFGFGSSDNPVFANMHEASALVAGGTVVGAEAIMSGQVQHAFVPAGGLHHAHHARAAGFCIYNDPAVAIAAVRARYDCRVVYIDVDAHHGDGVEEIFYKDPQVLTISMHESGRHLFPGTGFVEDLGAGAGRGFAVNVPLEPYTTDAPFLRVLDEVVVPLVRAFKPDLLVTQCGCDSHWDDPLTHLATSTRIWPVLTHTFHDLAHDQCQGRWLATGGGGYDLYSVVPRAWTILFAGMVGVELPTRLPEQFLALRRQYTDEPLEEHFLDAEAAPIAPERQQAIEAVTQRTINRVLETIFPLIIA